MEKKKKSVNFQKLPVKKIKKTEKIEPNYHGKALELIVLLKSNNKIQKQQSSNSLPHSFQYQSILKNSHIIQDDLDVFQFMYNQDKEQQHNNQILQQQKQKKNKSPNKHHLSHQYNNRESGINQLLILQKQDYNNQSTPLKEKTDHANESQGKKSIFQPNQSHNSLKISQNSPNKYQNLKQKRIITDYNIYDTSDQLLIRRKSLNNQNPTKFQQKISSIAIIGENETRRKKYENYLECKRQAQLKIDEQNKIKQGIFEEKPVFHKQQSISPKKRKTQPRLSQMMALSLMKSNSRRTQVLSSDMLSPLKQQNQQQKQSCQTSQKLNSHQKIPDSVGPSPLKKEGLGFIHGLARQIDAQIQQNKQNNDNQNITKQHDINSSHQKSDISQNSQSIKNQQQEKLQEKKQQNISNVNNYMINSQRVCVTSRSQSVTKQMKSQKINNYANPKNDITSYQPIKRNSIRQNNNSSSQKQKWITQQESSVQIPLLKNSNNKNLTSFDQSQSQNHYSNNTIIEQNNSNVYNSNQKQRLLTEGSPQNSNNDKLSPNNYSLQQNTIKKFTLMRKKDITNTNSTKNNNFNLNSNNNNSSDCQITVRPFQHIRKNTNITDFNTSNMNTNNSDLNNSQLLQQDISLEYKGKQAKTLKKLQKKFYNNTNTTNIQDISLKDAKKLAQIQIPSKQQIKTNLKAQIFGNFQKSLQQNNIKNGSSSQSARIQTSQSPSKRMNLNLNKIPPRPDTSSKTERVHTSEALKRISSTYMRQTQFQANSLTSRGSNRQSKSPLKNNFSQHMMNSTKRSQQSDISIQQYLNNNSQQDINSSRSKSRKQRCFNQQQHKSENSNYTPFQNYMQIQAKNDNIQKQDVLKNFQNYQNYLFQSQQQQDQNIEQFNNFQNYVDNNNANEEHFIPTIINTEKDKSQFFNVTQINNNSNNIKAQFLNSNKNTQKNLTIKVKSRGKSGISPNQRRQNFNKVNPIKQLYLPPDTYDVNHNNLKNIPQK